MEIAAAALLATKVKQVDNRPILTLYWLNLSAEKDHMDMSLKMLEEQLLLLGAVLVE